MEVEMKKGGEGRENRGWEEKRRKKRKRILRLTEGKEEIIIKEEEGNKGEKEKMEVERKE